MAQHEIEVILTRQLASYLAMPIFIVDPAGTLIFYNEPAERILGQRFEETGELAGNEWGTAFNATDESGAPLAPDQLPLMIALEQHRPVHSRIGIVGLDKVRRVIAITAMPLIGHAHRHLGAIAVFWEVGDQ